MRPLTLLAVWTGKPVQAASRRAGRGGSTLPGRVARSVSGQMLEELAAALPRGTVTVSGTNGKTTTATRLAATGPWGRVRGDIAVMEADEATLPRAGAELAPRAAVVTNFFRDQLDRYGELETTVRHVRRGPCHVAPGGRVALNADDPLCASLGRPGPAPAVAAAAEAAGAAGAVALGVGPDAIAAGLGTATTAFGRMERLEVEGREVYLPLVKNPVGYNEVLRTLLGAGAGKHLVLALNDRCADGTDISWIWDVDFELLVPDESGVHLLVCTGSRAEDMALRLKYAGISPARITVERDMRKALEQGLSLARPGQLLYVLPTYTAMLQIKGIMHRMGHVRHLWEV